MPLEFRIQSGGIFKRHMLECSLLSGGIWATSHQICITNLPKNFLNNKWYWIVFVDETWHHRKVMSNVQFIWRGVEFMWSGGALSL